MNVKALVKKEEKISFYEFQLKIKADINTRDILKLGAKQLGCVIHEDSYLILKGREITEDDEFMRIRREGGENLIFIYKKKTAHKKAEKKMSIKKVIKKPIGEKEVDEIMRDYREVITVNKKRTIFLYKNIVISLDEVENLGNYAEFVASTEEDYFKINFLISKLGLDPEKLTTLSYFELAMMNLSPFQRILLKIHERFGILAFGISSAVLTTLGMIVGLNSATSSRLAVISGIAAVAVADSLSDSLGMYAQKNSERGASKRTAFKHAFGAFFGKLIFALTFLLIFIIFPFASAMYISIAWGLLLIMFVNIQIAFIHEESVFKNVIKNIFIAIAVIIASYLAGKGIGILTGQ